MTLCPQETDHSVVRDPNRCFYWLGCHDCCTYIPKRICVTLAIDSEDDPQCTCKGGCRSFEWDCDEGAYKIIPIYGEPDELACGIDAKFTIEKDDLGGEEEECAFVLESAALGYVIDGESDTRLKLPFGETSMDRVCTCRYMDFTFYPDLSVLHPCCNEYTPTIKTWAADERSFVNTLVYRGVCPPLPENTGVNLVYDDELGCYRDAAWEGVATCVPESGHDPKWLPNTEDSRWLTPTCDPLYGPGEVSYDYTVRWEIDFDPAKVRNVVLGGRFAVDNALESVKLNGSSAGISLVTDPAICELLPAGNQWYYFELDPDQLVEGENVLVFTASNVKGTCADSYHMGFRCEFLCCVQEECVTECCPAPPNTGQYLMYLSEEDDCRYDARWTVTADGEGQEPFVPNDEDVHPRWIGNSEVSKWLAPNCTPAEIFDATDTSRVYAVEWDLTGHDIDRLHIFARVASDNLITAVELNGELLDFTADGTPCGETDPLTMSRWYGFELPSDLFVSGINVLSFTAVNAKGNCTAPYSAGFRAEFSCCDCLYDEDMYCVGLANTGVVRGLYDEVGGCYYDGVWRGTTTAIGNPPFPGTWLPPSAASTWITPTCTAGADFWTPSEYTATINFHVVRDPEKLKIVGRCLFDNNLVSVTLNGVDQGMSAMDPPCCPGSEQYLSTWFEFEICDGLKLGNNVLTFTILNTAGCCAAPFATGFRCELACAFKECLWVSDAEGIGWELLSGGCPDGYLCVEPSTPPDGVCDRLWTCCLKEEEEGGGSGGGGEGE